MSILGLPTTAKFDAEADYFYSHRRQILHQYPKGGAPLTGLMSMMPEEPVSNFQFVWYEKVYHSPTTKLRGTNPLTSTAPTTGDADDGTNLANGAVAVSTTVYMKVESTVDFRPGYIIEIQGTNAARIQFWVTAVTRGATVPSEKGYLTLKPVRAYTAAATDDTAGDVVRALGTAMGEGASGAGITPLGFKRPYAVQNQVQIFRTPFSFSGSVLQQGLKYDKTGPYKERAKDAVVEHMTSIERQIIWGRRSTTTRSALTAGDEDETVRTFSGIIEFLELWDAGSTGLTIDGATYAPYYFKGPSTSDADDDKRIIENASGTLTYKKFMQWAERIGRYHTSKTNEKLIVCGSGAIIAANEMLRQNSSFQVKEGQTIYGLDITTIITPFGKFHLMTHPLFNEDFLYRNWMLFLDIWSLKYRYLQGRDTRLLKMRQNPGDDRRKDEYLTECGIEFWHPRNNMLVKNVNTYVEA